MDSAILGKQALQKRLMSLCNLPADFGFKLLYRGSKDGFGASDFHRQCDEAENTLTIIQSTEGNIFGGFTRRAWSSNLGWEPDIDSFLFSLVNKEDKPVLMPSIDGRNAIFNNKKAGPCFGCANDIFISDNSNANLNSYTNLGSSFRHPVYTFGSDNAMTFLSGAFYNFQVAEIEVFLIENLNIEC